MGHVRTIPQVDQAGQKSGNVMLEITYGGLESPFMGIDSSAPAAYIDPKCFADADGFLVIDNKLVVVSLQGLATPTLWNGVSGVQLLKFGTFFSSIYGQLNYALGYVQSVITGPPQGLQYAFYITAWNSSGVIDNSVLFLNLYRTTITAVPATLVLPVLMGEPSNYADTGDLALNYGASSVFGGNIGFGYTPGMTVAQAVTGIVTAINIVSASTHFTAAPSLDGLSVVLTAVTPGAAGNNLQVADDSFSNIGGNSPAFYFPTAPNPEWSNLQGGKDALFVDPPQGPFDVSTTEVGGVLYIAGIGPFILKYAGPQTFAISTVYNGVQVIRKFAGSLIGLGTITQLGTVLQNTDMIFSWSAANNLDEWSPVDASGNVTGAGFAQLADIADYLSSLIVSNNTAFIIRSQGISYATAIQNGTQPFQFAHIGLGEEGEGAQSRDLVCQYDQTGAYVGNSDIFQVSGSISSIGAKIKAALFSALELNPVFLSSTSCAVFIGGDTFPLVLFMIGNLVFIYNPPNNTWMKVAYATPAGEKVAEVAPLYTNTTAKFLQSQASLALQAKPSIGAITPPSFVSLIEGVPNINAINLNNPQITFPQEELLFGRDVVIDALYIALWGNVSENTTVQFYFNGILFSSIVLDPATYNSLSGNPTEIKVFPTGTVGTGVFTSHSPQLQVKIVALGDVGTAQVRFSKIQAYASFEPAQKPV